MLGECETSEKVTSTSVYLVDSVPQRCKRKRRKQTKKKYQVSPTGMKDLVCSRRPTRAPAVPGTASGQQCLHDLPGTCPVCTEGLCMTQALSLRLLHIQKPKHPHIVTDWKTPGQRVKTLQFCLDKPFSQKRRHPPENMIAWESHCTGWASLKAQIKKRWLLLKPLAKELLQYRPTANEVRCDGWLCRDCS